MGKQTFTEVELRVLDKIRSDLDEMHNITVGDKKLTYDFYVCKNDDEDYCKFVLKSQIRPAKRFTIDGYNFAEAVGNVYLRMADLY